MLKVLAVTAPHWPTRPVDIDVLSFTAGTPFSLQNAVRQAAGFASQGIGAWGSSNWTTLTGRQASVLLLEYMDEAQAKLEELLTTLKPNLVLIGAMTLGFPGAIEIARLVRKKRGGDCLIILGGKHANETLRYTLQNKVEILSCSPLELMRNQVLSPVAGRPLFDFVVSGDGEELVTVLGEVVHDQLAAGHPIQDALPDKSKLRRARGRWIVGWISDKNIETLTSTGIPLDYDVIPTAPSLFGLQSHFPIFSKNPTGHAYSDMGKGCIYNCFFCSERFGLTGKPVRSEEAVDRLMLHFEDIWLAGGEGLKGEVAAFVEDSILLGGDKTLISILIERLRKRKFRRLSFGCQLTVNDIEKLEKSRVLNKLAEVGCSYIAFGMETVNEGLAVSMSKHTKHGLWTEANRHAIKYLNNAKIRAGVYILWGLGESQLEREHQLEQLQEWKSEYDGPIAVGLNWATLHPGAAPGPNSHASPFWRSRPDQGTSMTRKPLPDFTDWGTPETSDSLTYFVELFGEISITYPYYYELAPPDNNDLGKLQKLFLQVSNC